MSSPSDNDSDQEERRLTSSDSDDARKNRTKRASRSTKKTIESDGSSESDSDNERSKPKKGKKQVTKKPALKRKRHSSSSGGDDVDDDLFVDAADKARVMAMSELDKEKEIFNRMEQRDVKRTRDEIAQKLEAAKKSEGKKEKKKQRKDQISDASDSDRSKSKSPVRKISASEDSDLDAEFHRPSEVNKKKKEKNAFAELKQKRKEIEKKNAKNAALSIDAVFGSQSSGSSSSSSSSPSSRSSSSSRDSSPDARFGREEEKVVKKEVDILQELVRARLSRFKLSQIVHAPFFKDTVVGCYVRVGMGAYGGNQSKYKIWQIVDVEETNKVYDIDSRPEQGKVAKRTNKGLRCKFGRQDRVFRMAFVSNTPFEQSEFEEWLATTKAEGTMPTMDQIEKKEQDIKKAINYKFSDADIDAMIKEKSRFEKVPKNFAMTKAELSKQKVIAQQRGDLSEVQRIQKEIDELERHADSLDKKRSQDIMAIAWINQRNRNKIKDEMLSGNVKFEDTSADDPFTRKKGGMKVVAGTKRDGSKPEEAKADSATPVPVATPSTVKKSEVPKLIAKKSTNLFDLHHNVNFEIDMNRILGAKNDEAGPSFSLAHSMSSNASNNTVSNTTSVPTEGKTKGLSLEEYRQRKKLAAQGGQ